MQRMLVTLVLFLTVVTAVLGVFLFNLYEEVKSRTTSRTTAVQPDRPAHTAADPARVTNLEQKLSGLLSEMERLRKDQAKTRRALVEAARVAPTGNTAPGPAPVQPSHGGYADRNRGGGEFVVTDEDIAYFRAVQERVQREQRIDSVVKSSLRRIERLARSGDIAALDDASRARVSEVLRGYAVSQDDLVTRYYRSPNEIVGALTPEQKRDAMKEDRAALATATQQEFVGIVGEKDAEVLAERTLSGGRASMRGLAGRDRGTRRGR